MTTFPKWTKQPDLPRSRYLPVGLALKGIALLQGAAFAAFWMHALTIGALATMILAVMTRAALGHTGRPLQVRPAIAVAYLLLGVVSGSDLQVPSLRSGLALAYLVVFGSIVAFSAFTFLVATVRPTLAMSYAYVNPVIAVLLGTLFADEELSVHLLVALPIILVGVAIATNGPLLAARLRRGRPGGVVVQPTD